MNIVPVPIAVPPVAAVYQTGSVAVEVNVVVPPTFMVVAPETAAVGFGGTEPPATVTATWSEPTQPFVPVTVNVYVVLELTEQIGFKILVADKPAAADQAYVGLSV